MNEGKHDDIIVHTVLEFLTVIIFLNNEPINLRTVWLWDRLDLLSQIRNAVESTLLRLRPGVGATIKRELGLPLIMNFRELISDDTLLRIAKKLEQASVELLSTKKLPPTPTYEADRGSLFQQLEVERSLLVGYFGPKSEWNRNDFDQLLQLLSRISNMLDLCTKSESQPERINGKQLRQIEEFISVADAVHIVYFSKQKNSKDMPHWDELTNRAGTMIADIKERIEQIEPT